MLKKLLVFSLSLLAVNYTLYAAEPNYPLHKAAKNGDVNLASNADGEIPLCRAARKGNFKIVRALLAYGADVNGADEFSRTPLHWAAMKGQYEVAQLLLAQPTCNINLTDNKGNTPLHIAKLRYRTEFAYLVSHWHEFAQGLNESFSTLLTAQHNRCGINSPMRFIKNSAIIKIIDYLRPGNCIYSNDEIQQHFAQLSKNIIETCAICQEDHPKNGMITPGNCKHLFCKECLKQYIETERFIHYTDGSSQPIINNVCPVCRRPIKTGIIFVSYDRMLL